MNEADADDDDAVAAKRNRWGSLELQCNNAINETAVTSVVSAAKDETRSKRPRHTTPSHRQVQQQIDQPSTNTTIKTVSTITTTSLKDWINNKKSDVDNRIDQCVKIAYMLVVKLSKGFEEVNNKDNSSADVEDEEHLSGQMDFNNWTPKPKDIFEECITITMDTSTGSVNDVGFVSIYQNFDWGDDE